MPKSYVKNGHAVSFQSADTNIMNLKENEAPKHRHSENSVLCPATRVDVIVSVRSVPRCVFFLSLPHVFHLYFIFFLEPCQVHAVSHYTNLI